MTKRRITIRKRGVRPRKWTKGGGHTTQRNRVGLPTHCAPMVRGKTIAPTTCLTPDILQQLKTSFNENNPSHPIHDTDPAKIWQALNEKLTSCSAPIQDTCLLQTLHNDAMRQKIQDAIFVPESPTSWLQNKNEWLSNNDISRVLKQYETAYSTFRAFEPTPIDFDTRLSDGGCVTREMCQFSVGEQLRNGKTKIGIVFNLDKHTGSGTHWVAMFIDLDNHFGFYFDSNGDAIPPEINQLKNRIMKECKEQNIPLRFYSNRNMEHQKSNSECGMYSLFFIITMLTGNQSVREKIKLFKTKRITDARMEQYRKIFFRPADHKKI